MASDHSGWYRGRAALLYLAVLVLCANIYAIPPLVLSITRELGIDHFQAGLLMTTFAVAYCAGNALMGYLSDRLGGLRVMTAGLALGFSASLVMSVTASFPVMVVSRIFCGTAAAAMTAPCLVTLMHLFPPARRSLSVSLHLAALTLGSALVFLLTPLLLPYLSWRVVLRLYALAGAAVLLPFLRLLWTVDTAAPQAGVRTRSRTPSPAVHAIALLCAVLFVSLFQIGGTLTWLPPWLQERGGFSPLQIGLAGMSFSLVGIPSTLLGGLLADRLPTHRPPRIMAMSMAGALVSSSILALAWLQQARWFPLVLLVVILARWGTFMSVGPLLSLGARLAPPGGEGAVLGVINTVAMSGSVVASFAGGLIITTTGGYGPLWALFAAVLLVSALVFHPLLRRAWSALPAGSGGAVPEETA